MVILIRCQWERRRNAHAYPDQPFHPVIDYLSYGYQFYLTQYREAVARKQSSAVAVFKDLMGKYAVVLAGDIALVTRYLQLAGPGDHKNLCKQLLEQICTVAEPYIKEGADYSGNANYMIAIRYDEASEDQKKSAHFTWGDTGRYSHLLILEDYAYPAATTAPAKFALPVEDPEKTKDYLEWTLPGAPEAFLRKEALAVGDKIVFGKHVPVEVQEQIKEYLARQNFTCFISLVIPGQGHGRPIGILNIETNHNKILHASEETQNELGKMLHPFCMLLGVLFGKEKGGG